MARSRTLLIPLSILGLFLFGTVIVLSTVSYYLAIDPASYLTESEVPPSAGAVPANNSHTLERIPRIIHQTWKTDTLPERWQAVSATCTSLMPDYEYMLWTDKSSRDFIAKEYPWFLSTFDGYTYNIQRADAIRYFVLHHYGGVYLDLDVGCLRSLDPLLAYSGHPFMEQTIHNLIPFDHNYFLNYPTVMFSTGPMYVSAQYGLYLASHPPSAAEDVRVLPKSLYGKNASPLEAPHSFFSHHYGSSWHADDAAFITFLGKWGRFLMKIGGVILVMGVIRSFWSRSKRGTAGLHIGRRHRHTLSENSGGLDLTGLLSSYTSRARRAQRGGRHAASGSLSSSSSDESLEEGMMSAASSSPSSSHPASPTLELPAQLSLPVLSVSYDSRAASPGADGVAGRISDAFKRAGSWGASFVGTPSSYFSTASRSSDALGLGRVSQNGRDRADSTRAHIVGRVPLGGSSEGSTSLGRRASSQRRNGRPANDSQSFIAFLPAIFTTSSSSSGEAGRSRRHSQSSGGRRERERRAAREKAFDTELSEAAEAKAREAGYTLPLHSNGAPTSNSLGVPSASAGGSVAGSSRAPSPNVFYTPRTSLGSEPSPSSTPVPPSPLLIDSLARDASVATTGLAPPPYGGIITRSLSVSEGEPSGMMTP